MRITSCVPLPESGAVSGWSSAFSAMLSAAVREPLAEGLNDTAMVQLPPAASDELQVVACAKSAALGPVKVMPVMLRAALPVLLRVTV